jgi:Mg2+ and Co2+ transporter CorA
VHTQRSSSFHLDLHPLALEDVLHQPRSAFLSKADYYARHLFLRVLCHTLADQHTEEDNEKSGGQDSIIYANPATKKGTTSGLPRSSSPEPMDETEAETDAGNTRSAYYNHQRIPTRDTLFPEQSGGDIESEYPTLRNRINHRALTFKSKRRSKTADEGPARKHARMQRKQRLQNAQAIERLKGDHRVDVRIHPVCIFLLRTGTVITVTRPSTDTPTYEDFAEPIRTRLQHRDTSLRASADPSLLVHALLDLVVDHGFSIVDAYQSELLALEHKILLRTSMSAVRALHILEQDLNRHKRTLEPVRTVLYGLRRYDTDRAAALLGNEPSAERAKMQQQGTQQHPDDPGFMSRKAKIYLADVYDHADYVIESIDMFASTAENLINYTFNARKPHYFAR